ENLRDVRNLSDHHHTLWSSIERKPYSDLRPTRMAICQVTSLGEFGSGQVFSIALAKSGIGLRPVALVKRLVADQELKYPSNCSRGHCASNWNDGASSSANGKGIPRYPSSTNFRSGGQ